MAKLYRQSQTFEDRIVAAEDKALGLNGVPTTYAGAHTLSAADIGRTVTISGGSGVAFTYPQDSADLGIPVGASGRVLQLGAGLVTHTAGSGATLLKGNATAKTLQQGGVVRWEKISANTYSISGDLALS